MVNSIWESSSCVSSESHIIIVKSSVYHIPFDIGIVWYTFSHKFHTITKCACTNDTHSYYIKSHRLTTYGRSSYHQLLNTILYSFFPPDTIHHISVHLPSLSSS